MSLNQGGVGWWAGRIDLAIAYGEQEQMLSSTAALAAAGTGGRWLLTGWEQTADLATLHGRGVPSWSPIMRWPPLRLVRASGFPAATTMYRGLRILHALRPMTTIPRFGGAVVLTVQDAAPWSIEAVSGRARNMVDAAVARADLVLTLTETTAAELEALHPRLRGRLRVIGNGLDHELFHADAAADTHLHGSFLATLPDEYVLYVGGWSARKGLDVLAAAYESLDRARRPNLLLTGAPYDFRGQQLRDRFVACGAYPLGYVSRQVLPALLRRALCVVFPTRYEGWGLPVLEAQACGSPVICSDIPPLREVTGGQAVFIPSDDSVQLAEAIASSSSADRSRLRKAGLTNAARYTWGNVAARIMRAYEECV